MAGRTGLRKAAVMRVFVAVGAQVESKAGISRFSLRPVGVALGALHLGMQAGERITRLAVIEVGQVDGLPVGEVVAGLAIRPQSTFVKIFMAGDAGRRQTEEGVVQVLDLNGVPFLRGDS